MPRSLRYGNSVFMSGFCSYSLFFSLIRLNLSVSKACRLAGLGVCSGSGISYFYCLFIFFLSLLFFLELGSHGVPHSLCRGIRVSSHLLFQLFKFLNGLLRYVDRVALLI